MTLFKMWQKQMKQKAKNGRKKLVFENTKEKEKSRKRDCRFSKCNKCKWKITQKRNEKNRFWKYKKIRKRGCRFSKCNQHLRPLLLLHAIKKLQSQQKHRNATLFFIDTSMIKQKRCQKDTQKHKCWISDNHCHSIDPGPIIFYQTKPTKPYLTNQTCKAKPTKSNQTYQNTPTKSNPPNQTCQTKIYQIK